MNSGFAQFWTLSNVLKLESLLESSKKDRRQSLLQQDIAIPYPGDINPEFSKFFPKIHPRYSSSIERNFSGSVLADLSRVEYRWTIGGCGEKETTEVIPREARSCYVHAAWVERSDRGAHTRARARTEEARRKGREEKRRDGGRWRSGQLCAHRVFAITRMLHRTEIGDLSLLARLSVPAWKERRTCEPGRGR